MQPGSRDALYFWPNVNANSSRTANITDSKYCKHVCRPDVASLLCCWKQESLANAKGSTRQPWYIVRKSPNRLPFRIAQQYQRNLYIVVKYFQYATIPSLTLWVYLHSFSCCSRSNMPTSAKFRENLNVQQFKVIEGRWFWYQSKGHMRVPISD